MKKLFIIRHGKSDQDSGAKTDFERPLNERGLKDAPNMGKHLNTHFSTPDLIISSPAKRTLTTARLIAHEVDYPLEDIQEELSIYEAPVQNLISVINNLPDDQDVVYLVGHNPGVSMLTTYLSDEYVSMKTCNVSVLEAEIDSWKMVVKGIFQMEAFLSPKSI